MRRSQESTLKTLITQQILCKAIFEEAAFYRAFSLKTLHNILLSIRQRRVLRFYGGIPTAQDQQV